MNSSNTSSRARDAAARAAKCALLIGIAASCMGMIGGVKSVAGTENVYGLVALRFGFPDATVSCSGVLYKNWVITHASCFRSEDVVVTMSIGSFPFPNKNNPNDKSLSGLSKGSYFSIPYSPTSFRRISSGDAQLAMVKLPGPFMRGGSPVASKVVFEPRLPKVGEKLQCFGRGDDVDGPKGDPSETSRGNPYRGAEFKVVKFTGTNLFNIGYGQTGEKPARGDNGGPCFAVDYQGQTGTSTILVGLMEAGEFKTDKNGNFIYLGEAVTGVAPLVNQIESIAGT